MSGEEQSGFVLDTAKIESEQGEQNLTSNGFILNSPTNSGIKNSSPALKKTKYDKLLKLYKEHLEKKRKINSKKEELDALMSQYQALTAQKGTEGGEKGASNDILLSLRNHLEQLRKDTLKEQQAGQLKSKELLKQIYELDDKANKIKQSKSLVAKEIKQLEDEVEKSRHLVKERQDEKVAIDHKVEAETDKLNKLKATIAEFASASSFSLRDLENQKSFLANQIKTFNDEITQVKKQLENKKASASEGDKHYAELQKKHSNLKKQLEELKSKYNEDEKIIKDSVAKIKKEKQAEQKITKSIAELTKQVTTSAEATKKAEKEEQIQKQKFNKLKSQQGGKQFNQEIEKAKRTSEKLKSNLDSIKKRYQEEQDKADNLVAPMTVQKLKASLEEQRALHQKNKSIPERHENVKKEIKDLKELKQKLIWEVDPTLKELETVKKREQEDQARLEQQLKESVKEQEKVTKTLDQYMKAYPDFQVIRLKNKKSINKKQVKEEPQPKKVEEPAKKKKKGKNEEKSPEPAEEVVVQKVEKKESVKVQKVEKKEGPASPLPVKVSKPEPEVKKAEPEPNPVKEQGEKKKKKNKK